MLAVDGCPLDADTGHTPRTGAFHHSGGKPGTAHYTLSLLTLKPDCSPPTAGRRRAGGWHDLELPLRPAEPRAPHRLVGGPTSRAGCHASHSSYGDVAIVGRRSGLARHGMTGAAFGGLRSIAMAERAECWSACWTKTMPPDPHTTRTDAAPI